MVPGPRRARAFPERGFLRALLLVALVGAGLAPLAAARASTEEITPDRVRAGTLLFRMREGYRVATRINTDVTIRVSGLVGRTTVSQEFRNDGVRWVEGVYVFPLPDRAAVDGLRMRIGERYIEGEIRERQAAKRRYEQARREGKKASLVEQQRTNLFTTAVANVAPGETVRIEIDYLEVLGYEAGAFSLRVPTTLTPRYIPGRPLADRRGSGWSADTDRVPDASLITPPVVARSADHRVTLTADIDAGVPLDVIASRYHRIRVTESAGRYAIELDEPAAAMDHDIELVWRPVKHAAPRALVFSESVDGQPHLLVMLLPPEGPDAPVSQAPRELVFVIDTSGSMHGTSLAQAKAALKHGLDTLGPDDFFNVIQFNSHASALAGDSLAATPGNLAAAAHYVDALTAQGGTEMRPALELALSPPATEARLRQVVFITDGSVGNENELFGVIEKDLGTARLFTVGIGSAPNGWFMRKAAEAGRGATVVISALHEVEEKMTRLFDKLERPQVTDVRLEWPAGLDASVYPETVPDLYAGEPVIVHARLGKAARPGDQLRISGRSGGGEWHAELPLAGEGDGAGTAALWARARVADLMDRARRGADAQETRDRVVATALRYGLVSRYTSLVAVDRTPVRPASEALAREQVPNLLPHGQSMQAIFGFPATATNAGRQRAAGSLAILFATLVLMRRVWNGRGRGRERARGA